MTTQTNEKVSQNNIFQDIYLLDKQFHEGKKSFTVLAFKIKEWNSIYYYLIARPNEMNRSFADAEDFIVYTRFKTINDMIDYIKKNNRYEYSIDDGLFYTSECSFRQNIILPRTPLKFSPEEQKKIIEFVPNWIDRSK